MNDPDYHVGSPDMKKTLSKENKIYKNALNNEVTDLSSDAKRLGKYALVAGGAAVGAYFLYQYLANDEESDTSIKSKLGPELTEQDLGESKKKQNPVLGYLKEQLAFIAITILREKLSELTGIDKNKLIKSPNEPTKDSDQK